MASRVLRRLSKAAEAIALGDFDKSFRRWLFAFDFFRQVRSDFIAIEHRPFFFVERDEHCDSQSFDNAFLLTVREREAIESGLVGNAY